MSIWKGTSQKTEKPWGTERGIGSPFGGYGKIIEIKADYRTSLKYYERRNQMMYCLSGKLSVFAPKEKEFGDTHTEGGNYFILEPGDSILIQCQNPYRIKALVDSLMIEVLVGLHNHDPVIMLEDDYGRTLETKSLT